MKLKLVGVLVVVLGIWGCAPQLSPPPPLGAPPCLKYFRDAHPSVTTRCLEAQQIADQVSDTSQMPRINVRIAELPSGYGGWCCPMGELAVSEQIQSLPTFLVVFSHELGHLRLGHPFTARSGRSHEEQLEREIAANIEGVKILQEFWGFSEEVAVRLYVTFLDAVQRSRGGLLTGHDPCREAMVLVQTFQVDTQLGGC